MSDEQSPAHPKNSNRVGALREDLRAESTTQARPDTEHARAVKVALVDGDELVGRLRAFSPDDEELILEEGGCRNGVRTARRLPACSVAYVAYRNQGAPALERERRPGVPLRVRIGPGGAFPQEGSSFSFSRNRTNFSAVTGGLKRYP